MNASRPDSAAWYDQHAGEYASRTDTVDLTDQYDRFLAHLPPGGRLLDAGCGPGRDSLAFLARGYEVTAVDASIGMVELASRQLGQPVLHLRHEDIAYDREFDGIWANATLLHVPHSDLPEVLARYRKALVPDGVMFASFKLGTGEVIASERLFANQDAASFREVLAAVPGLTLIDMWTCFDRRPGREHEQWLNVLVQRTLDNDSSGRESLHVQANLRS
jgi:SAM-dependent methyltransferase